jgi:periplasmic copper chaperone A
MNPYTEKLKPRTRLALAVLLSACLFAGSSAAAEKKLEVRDVWSKQTMPGQKVAGVYLQIRSPQDARLVEVQSPLADSAEMHSMKMEGEVMRMRKLDAIELPAGKTVKLAPGGEHIMLFDIKRPLKPGDQVPVTLVLEQNGKRTSVPVQALVKALEEAK